MGVLVDVRSGVLRVRRADFPLLLAGLRRLAEKSPSEFHDADSVRSAADPVEALDGDGWLVAVDSAGDIVGIATGDKAPADSSESWPHLLLAALALAIREPAEVYVHWEFDGDEETVYHVGPAGVATTKQVRTVRHPWPPVPPERPVGADPVYRPLPETSFGLLWRVEFDFRVYQWFRRRGRVRAVVDALAGTAWWPELDLLRGTQSAMPGPLSPARVARAVADGRTARWVLTGAGGEVRIGLQIDLPGVRLTARVRDAALARLGPAVIDDVLSVVRHVVEANRDDLTVSGYAVPVGARPLVYPRIRRGSRRWPVGAVALLLDRRACAPSASGSADAMAAGHETMAAELPALVAAPVPDGIERTEFSDVVVLRWVSDPTAPEAVGAACAAQERFMADHVPTETWPAGERADLSAPTLTADPTQIGGPIGYTITWQIEFDFDDRILAPSEPSLLAMVLERLAETAWWAEVVPDEPGAADAVRARVLISARRVVETLERPGGTASVRLEYTNRKLGIVASAGGDALDRLGTRAVSGMIALVVAVARALRGRAQLTWASAAPSGGYEPDGPSEFRYPRVRPPRSSRGIVSGAFVDVFDPDPVGAVVDYDLLLAARAMAAAPVPESVTRETRDGLCVLSWIDDPRDHVAVALACGRRERWTVSLLDSQVSSIYNPLGDTQYYVDSTSHDPYARGGSYGYVAIETPDGGVDESAWQRAERYLREPPGGAEAIGLLARSRAVALQVYPRARAAGFDRVIYGPATRDGSHPTAGTSPLGYWDPDPAGPWQDPPQ